MNKRKPVHFWSISPLPCSVVLMPALEPFLILVDELRSWSPP